MTADFCHFERSEKSIRILKYALNFMDTSLALSMTKLSQYKRIYKYDKTSQYDKHHKVLCLAMPLNSIRAFKPCQIRARV